MTQEKLIESIKEFIRAYERCEPLSKLDEKLNLVKEALKEI